ncbi:6820_t:CDS:1, partial [Acaulospora morrowiae]
LLKRIIDLEEKNAQNGKQKYAMEENTELKAEVAKLRRDFEK